MTIPPELVSVLSTTGLPIGKLDTELARVLPGSPNTHIGFMLEFEKAPAMKMLRISPAAAARIDTELTPFTLDKLPPLETDLAICASKVVNGQELPIEPNRNGNFEMPKLVDDNLPFIDPTGHFIHFKIQLARLSGSISEIRRLIEIIRSGSSIDQVDRGWSA